MNAQLFFSVAVLAAGLGWGCGTSRSGDAATPQPATAAASKGRPWQPYLYAVRAGGPNSFVPLTNRPESNPVSMALTAVSDDTASFTLSNGEHHSILLWNVRVQVRSRGKGTDGFGWDTVDDDYPVLPGTSNSTSFAPGTSVRFQVRHPERTPWRVCVLYSTDWTDSGNSYSGNYEVVSLELKE